MMSPVATPVDSPVASTVRDTESPALVARTFAVLGAFRDAPVLGVSDLARRTGLPRTTVHRLANQLVDVGALGRVGVRFRLGPTLFELGNLHYPPKIRESVQPFLEDLRQLCGGDVGLLESAGDDVIVIQTARARRSGSTLLRLGVRVPADSCAGGLVLVAFNTTKPTRRQLEILTAGCVVDHGVSERGRTVVAVPVRNRRGRVLGALMVCAPMILGGDDLDRFVHAVTNFAPTVTIAGQSAQVDFLARALPKIPRTEDH
jgi:DNA-binding IclR family transcriptional regulator